MAEIAWLSLGRGDYPAELWPAVAATIAKVAAQSGVELRDCIVLVPFAQLLPLAHRAFAQQGGWIPRVETTSTLAKTLGLQALPGPGDLTFDSAVDALNAESMLGRQSWGRSWAQRDSNGFKRAATHLTLTAHAFARAAHAMRPQARWSYWARCRELLAPVDGLGARERALARIALEWAALSAAPATDRLLSLLPAAWFAVSAGGRDALTLNLFEAAPAKIACVIVNLDAGMGEEWELRSPPSAPTLAICADFEDEAQCAAARVLQHLQQGCRPVALIAQDRVLVRRVRALLERESVTIRDETGWKLATTRAAGRVMALLLAAQPEASADALLDWLKTGTRWHAVKGDADAVISSLEAQCRKSGVSRVSSLAAAELDAPSRVLLRCAVACLEGFSTGGARPLRRWSSALASALEACDALESLRRDDAGQQVIATLRLAPTDPARDGNVGAVAHIVLTLSEFARWVNAALESANFLPRSMPEAERAEPAEVVVAPLAQTIARAFGAVVFPGSDNVRLGTSGQMHPLLSDAQAVELGLGGMQQRRDLEGLAFAHLLNCAPLTLLRRQHDGEQRLANSPFIDQLAASLQSDGRVFAPWVDPRIARFLERSCVARSGPAVAAMLPQRLSASAFEALRECPYRFFAKVVLGLREQDELERDIEKRDYGTWLHAVLHRFHTTRGQAAPQRVEVDRLAAIALTCQVEFGLDGDVFLPFAASFKALAPRYIEWLHQRDSEGQRWLHGEYTVVRRPDELEGVQLEGQIDRIDVIGEPSPSQTVLMDYKTGNVEALRRKVREPLEDTQLAFYAALLPESSPELPRPLRAVYLALDSRKSVETIEHKGVCASAQTLVKGLAAEFRRLRGGERLLPLGEGDTCEYCEARGLCRRDHWAHPVAGSQ